MDKPPSIAKKTVILYVLNILKKYSSREHPISQTAIASYLQEINVPCDRKTVGRNVAYLREFGYPIAFIPGKGFYLEADQMKNAKNPFVL